MLKECVMDVNEDTSSSVALYSHTADVVKVCPAKNNMLFL